MFNVPKVRMYGIPPVIFIPGQGLGTYDWSDHSFLIPSFPTIKEGQSIAYALGTFRWDTDEDRKVRAPYETIKENRKKSVMALATSFYKDYSIWMTKERLGYRVLSREAHKIFKHRKWTNEIQQCRLIFPAICRLLIFLNAKTFS